MYGFKAPNKLLKKYHQKRLQDIHHRKVMIILSFKSCTIIIKSKHTNLKIAIQSLNHNPNKGKETFKEIVFVSSSFMAINKVEGLYNEVLL